MPDFTRSQCMSKLHASLRVYHVRCSCCCRFTANKDTKFRITPAALLLSGPNAMQLQLFSTSRPRWPNPSKLVEPHTLVGGVSEPVCTIGGGVGGGGWGMWSKTRCHKLHAFGDHTQHTGIYSILASLYNLLRKDVEQDTLLQASMLLAIMPKTLVCLQHFCFFVQHTAQGCGARQRCHKCPCLRRPCPKHWYLQHFCFFVQHTAQGCGARHVVTSIYALATMPKTLVFTCSNRNIPNLQQLLRDF